MRTLLRASAAVLVCLAGCAATASFHSRTGRSFTQVTPHAVISGEQDAEMLRGAGGMIIGTIDAKAISTAATQADVTDEAARVAGESGGTHIILTERGTEWFTVTNPAEKHKECTEHDGEKDCDTTYTPETTETYAKPTAQYLVIRVEPAQWGLLREDCPSGDAA